MGRDQARLAPAQGRVASPNCQRRPQGRRQRPTRSVGSREGGETYPIDPDHIVRVDPDVKRKITAGPDGLRLLALGATPGEAYDAGGTL